MSARRPIEAAAEADRLFFEANPNRRHRIRAMVDGELPPTPDAPPGWERYVVTCCLRPGVRARVPFAGSVRIPDSEQAAERAFWAVRQGDAVALAELAAETAA